MPENNIEFGEAIWVKVFTTELEDPIALEDLVGGNPKVEQAVTEVEWQLLQTDTGNPLAGQLESGYGVPVGPNAASILRRYEFYKYSGEYDPETHEAWVTFSDSHPNDPNDPISYDPTKIVDLGIYLGAQNAAVNLAAVPESETYAMLLVGLGLVGFVVRRRKHHAANPSAACHHQRQLRFPFSLRAGLSKCIGLVSFPCFHHVNNRERPRIPSPAWLITPPGS